MNYIWTEDAGAGFHFWELVNKYLFHGSYAVESKEATRESWMRLESWFQRTATDIIWHLASCMTIWM